MNHPITPEHIKSLIRLYKGQSARTTNPTLADQLQDQADRLIQQAQEKPPSAT